MTETGMFLYPWDLGADFAAFRDEYAATGCKALAAAVAYHHGNVLSARSGRITRIPEAAVGFAPQEDRYGRLKPFVRRDVVEAGTVRAVRDWCGDTNRHFSAWTVLLHNSTLGRAYPDVCRENAFGDRYTHALCPAHPEVQRYAEALVHDVCECLEPDSLMLESVTVPTPFHGEHHEIANIKPGSAALWLLSQCFCDHCRATADVMERTLHSRARETCKRILLRLLNRETAIPGSEQAQIAALMLEYPELHRYHDVGSHAVSGLVRRLADTAHSHDVEIRIMPSAVPHVVTSAYLEGMHFSRNAGLADMLLPLVYGTGETYATVRENIRLFDTETPIGMAMTLHPARYPSRGDFLGAVADAARLAPACAYFYNYSLASEERLEWVREAANLLRGTA